MRFLFIAVSALSLASCSNDAQPTHDVQFYLDNPDILKETIEKCRNDPGNLEDTPNCINAEEAAFKQMNANIRKAREEMK